MPALHCMCSSQVYKIVRLFEQIDPLVSLMMVEKVPDSTYEMVGGLDKQIKEIKEVIELPVKHPELFDALGIAQPKVAVLSHRLFFSIASIIAPFLLTREFFCMDHPALVKHCWHVLLHIIQNVRSFVSLAQN